ncbi:UDP-N-acetylmuramate--L-alanine ligase [Ginsengibacter hankyongi]|uniref:UDP-N-acetylmuramate--L-alanine ligase n=1 Tax=Ginsengibacter hankyongi TaxID=2607284 RepID=A0A5J5IN55_9BACT|nr:UDP-N-acetylmuramate--L-alanine ligase [Ginsengibacter hankyongi]KAA9041427.1 UDP-N-acetylmuramate--L-alanine ligase [Ginsengibacter hankyongi]
MKDYTAISRIYFIGIGGIGMSALAKYYLNKNALVSGYDKTVTNLTRQMENDGINIHYEDDIELLDKNAQLVVYTPAVPKDHKELNYYLHNNYELIKRSALLGEITKSSFNICIAGTHGKTTISTMVAHILRHSGFGCNAFLGGISVNYHTNFWNSDNNVSVVEADEYDRSFLQLSPDIALISAMDADHLDIYGTKENMEHSFVQFSGKLKEGGLLLTNYSLPAGKFSAANRLRYSLQNNEADVFADDIKLLNGAYEFNIKSKSWQLNNVKLNMGGMHNIENAVAAIAIANHLSIEPEKIKAAVDDFKGVKRRFEYIIKNDKTVFIDDYAHHPEELKALIKSAKNLFPEMRCTIVFQPHLFSRTRDFANEFAEVLNLGDDVYLLPIYPARELPIENVTSEIIADRMNEAKGICCTKEQLLQILNHSKLHEHDLELVITAGAGDIDQLVQPIKGILLK